MLFLLILFPVNVWILSRLDKYDLKHAEMFHAVLFSVMAIAAFILYGGIHCDAVASFFHLTSGVAALRTALGEEGVAFLAPFMVLETVCYALAVLAVTTVTYTVTRAIVLYIRSALHTWRRPRRFLGVSVAVPQLPPQKIYRMHCVMRC